MSREPSPPSDGAQEIRRTLAPTVALAAVSVAVALGFTRLVAGHDWLPIVVGAALLPHAIGLATRRWSAPAQVGVWAGGFAAYVVWAAMPTTTRWGLPTGDTLRALGNRLEAGLTILRDQSAPVADRPGVVLIIVVAVWIMACAADTLAFRRWASIGALGPAVTLFIWIAALNPGAANPARAAAALAITGAAFLALQHQVLQTRRRAAVGVTQPVPAPRQVVGGVGIAVVAALLAALLAPSLPGAGADPLVDLRDDDLGSSSYQTAIPPLVDVADNLRRGERVELFTVASPTPQYWRTVALDEYTSDGGGQWTLRAQDDDIDRGLDDAVPAGALRQKFTIGALSERWMPAAFSPVAVDDDDVLFVQDSRTLVTGRDSVSGLSYTVRSVPPADEPTPAQQRATDAPPADVARFTDLPDTVPTEVREIAGQVTEGATTPYDRARLLRDYFRDGLFTYDPGVDLTDEADATVEFLQTRRGFCVQFASTYALMARAVGIPSRVAVGFTPGTPDATGRYVVSNFEAHAWPEVWLPGVGWTNRFEPTPPSDGPGGSALPGDTAGAAVAPPVTAPPPTTIATTPGATTAPLPQPGTGDPVPSETAAADEDGGGIPAWVLVGLLLVALAGVAIAVAPVRKARRHAARRRRPDPAARVAGAWEEAVDRLRELGEPRPVHRTPSEVAAGADPVVGTDAAAALGLIADAHTEAQFGAGPVTEADADAAWEDLDGFRRALHDHLDWRTRVRTRLGPIRDRVEVGSP